MEINFGFQLTSIAGVSVDQIKKDKEATGEIKPSTAAGEEKEEEPK